jgi:hypothetical protein
LLLLSQALTLLSAKADNVLNGSLTGSVSRSAPARPASGSQGLQVASANFYYRLDEKASFIALKNQWQSEHRGELSPDQAQLFADQAYDKAGVEEVLTQWQYHGGPNPWVLSIKAHLFNDGAKAYLNVPVQVTVRAKLGDLRVNPAIQMTDWTHLQKSARWATVSGPQIITVSAIAPGEDQLLSLGRINLLSYLCKHPNQWPVELELQLRSSQFAPVSQRITLKPDHFVTPTWY